MSPGSRSVTSKKSVGSWFAIGGGAVVALVILLTVLFAGGDEDLPKGPPDGVVYHPISERDHTAGDADAVEYGVPVPAGGIHSPIWQNCGFYGSPIRAENAVHSLEHGAIWITYRRDLGEEAISGLRDLVRGRTKVLISEVSTMSVPLTATAWGVQLELQSYDEIALRRFIKEFKEGELAPEIHASCTGGVGSPE